MAGERTPPGGEACERVACVWDVAAELGEGPIWSAGEQALWCVDIKGKRVHRVSAATGETRSWAAPSSPGFLAPLAGGGWLIGLKSGLHRFALTDSTCPIRGGHEDGREVLGRRRRDAASQSLKPCAMVAPPILTPNRG
jgi:hypothetical protein